MKAPAAILVPAQDLENGIQLPRVNTHSGPVDPGVLSTWTGACVHTVGRRQNISNTRFAMITLEHRDN